MLVRDFIFVEQLCHFLGHHVSIVGNRDERDLFSGLWLLVCLLGLLRLPFRGFRLLSSRISHICSIHQLPRANAIQMIPTKTFPGMHGHKNDR